ncbi:MAG TPA: pitrilysin family protein [Thermoanaerobaculia bacterium]|nr:pitrilysin family protein [Thermoanaerobaculia bacterium]
MKGFREQVPQPGPIRPYEFPRVQRARLGSGLQVVAARHGRMPVATVALVIDAGAMSEPAGRSGLAHLVAHALDAGAAGRSGEQLAWDFERLGVELGVEADWDALTVFATAPSDRLEPLLALIADVVRRPEFPDDEILRLRDQQLAEILQREKEPRALANEMAARYIFGPDATYGRPLIGHAAEVLPLTRVDATAFHAARFRPAGAAVILVGDVEADTAPALVKRHFGDWTGAQPEPTQLTSPVPAQRTTVHVVDRTDAVQSEIRVGHTGVARRHPDYFALRVMNTILGGAFTSRLNLNLRERNGYTYGARSAFGFRRETGPFVIQTAVGTEVTAPAVAEILKEVRAMHKHGATADEVANARDYLAGIIPLELQTTGQLADRIAELVTYDLPDDYFADYRQRILGVTPEAVHAAARQHLRPEALAVVVVGNAREIRAPLEALGAGPLDVASP